MFGLLHHVSGGVLSLYTQSSAIWPRSPGVQYYILSAFLPDNPWTLQSQSKLADALYQQGRHLEEVSHREAVAAICTKSDEPWAKA